MGKHFRLPQRLRAREPWNSRELRQRPARNPPGLASLGVQEPAFQQGGDLLGVRRFAQKLGVRQPRKPPGPGVHRRRRKAREPRRQWRGHQQSQLPAHRLWRQRRLARDPGSRLPRKPRQGPGFQHGKNPRSEWRARRAGVAARGCQHLRADFILDGMKMTFRSNFIYAVSMVRELFRDLSACSDPFLPQLRRTRGLSACADPLSLSARIN